MARTARHEEAELTVAKQLVASAKTLQQLRQGQAMLLPALTGASMETTAEILGIGRNRVCVLRRQFRQAGGATFGERERRGGRRRELMSVEEEQAFLAPWVEQAKNGGVLVVPPIHAAYEQKVGKSVPRSTIYRLLARHGWRKVMPDTRHPKANVPAQEDFKKTPGGHRRPSSYLRQAVAALVSGRSPFRAFG
jgi:transposase